MKSFVLVPNLRKDTDLSVSRRTASVLIERGGTVYVEHTLAKEIDGATPYTDFPTDAELILVVGGDGSVIDASGLALAHDIPLLGINLGKIGYLSEVDPRDLSVLDKLFEEPACMTEQMLLSVSCEVDGRTVCSERLALNDIIVSHNSASGMADFSVSDSSGDAVRYRADGLIVATPAGSTAYSLSAGGPVVARDMEALIVTPVCAHSLFQRSILFSPKECIGIRNIGEEELHILVDGRPYMSLPPGGACHIGTAQKTLKMLKLSEKGVFSTLFQKIRTIETI